MNLNALQKLQIVLIAAKTTNDMPVKVSYKDRSANEVLSGLTQFSNTNGTTLVDICDAPSAVGIPIITREIS